MPVFPDVVITDIKMPVMDGVEACQLIKQKYPQVGVIALSNFNDESLIVDMLEAGARGYLLKNTNRNELLQAVKAVHAGNTYYCAATSSRLTQLILKASFNPYRAKSKADFTERELEVMRLICQQHTNKEIADLLHISPAHRGKLPRKNTGERPGAKNSVGIALYAIKKDIFKLEDIRF
jgi:DNA-binding NarL/FixJ family response regulator